MPRRAYVGLTGCFEAVFKWMVAGETFGRRVRISGSRLRAPGLCTHMKELF